MASPQSPLELLPRHFWLAGLRSFVLSTVIMAAFFAVGLLQGYYWVAAVLTLVLYGRAVWRFYSDRQRLTVVVDGSGVSGPGATRWSRRVTIAHGQINRERSGRSTATERLLGYRSIYGKDGQTITIDTVLIGPAQTAALLQRLKLGR